MLSTQTNIMLGLTNYFIVLDQKTSSLFRTIYFFHMCKSASTKFLADRFFNWNKRVVVRFYIL